MSRSCRLTLAMLGCAIFAWPVAGSSGSSAAPKTLGEILAANGDQLPVPFEKLMEASGGSEDNVILIPRGRSLVAKDNDYNSPRILLNPGSTSGETPTKLIIGYTPKTDSLEITSWNPVKKQYDFIEVKNYSDKTKQKIERAHEGKCTECHANNRLIFTPSPWSEVTDFDPFDQYQKPPRARKVPEKIAAALAPKKTYYGINLEKYKTAASDRVGSFAAAIGNTETARRTEDLCSKLCQDFG